MNKALFSLYRVHNIYKSYQNNIVNLKDRLSITTGVFKCQYDEACFIIPLIEKEYENLKKEKHLLIPKLQSQADFYLSRPQNYNPAIIGETDLILTTLIQTNQFDLERFKNESEELKQELEKFIEEQKTDLENAIENKEIQQIQLLSFTVNQLQKIYIILQNYTKLSLEWAWTEAYVCLRTCGDSKTRSKMKGIVTKIAIAIGVVSSANDVLEFSQKALLFLKQ